MVLMQYLLVVVVVLAVLVSAPLVFECWQRALTSRKREQRERALLAADATSVIGLKQRVDYLYGEYTGALAVNSTLRAKLKAVEEARDRAERELKDKAEALVETERLVGLNATK